MTDDALRDDDTAAPSYLTPALENYLYVHGFAGSCQLGRLLVPPLNPSDPPGYTLDSLANYWLSLDRRRYSSLPFFVRAEKVKAAYARELDQRELVPVLRHPNGLEMAYTRQAIDDAFALFVLMDAYDRISGIQARVRRRMQQETTYALMHDPA